MINIVILAAGQGKRMHSDLPKVLHPLAGQPLLAHVIATAGQLTEDHTKQRIVVVYGYEGEKVRTAIANEAIGWALQAEQFGTGHALRCALPMLDPTWPTLVLFGDVPMVSATTLKRLLDAAYQQLAILTVNVTDPTGYGRIVRDHHGVICRIVEQKDASLEEQAISEINTGIMMLPTARLPNWLDQLTNNNAQHEYYLTDVIALAAAEGLAIASSYAESEHEALGVNRKTQLANLERAWQQREAKRLLEAGVTLADPGRFDLRGKLHCGKDVFIDVNCLFIGNTVLGNGVSIGANSVLIDCQLADGVAVQPFSHLEKAIVGKGSIIGPYARLRPGANLAEDVHIGNFVEVKNTTIAAQSKANHLAYIGDAIIGERVNIGAGVITCNYDGANKHQTVIGNDVFVGSDVQLVAPLTICDGATIGAGTTVTQDVDQGALALSRVTQIQKFGWVRPQKNDKK